MTTLIKRPETESSFINNLNLTGIATSIIRVSVVPAFLCISIIGCLTSSDLIVGLSFNDHTSDESAVEQQRGGPKYNNWPSEVRGIRIEVWNLPELACNDDHPLWLRLSCVSQDQNTLTCSSALWLFAFNHSETCEHNAQFNV